MMLKRWVLLDRAGVYRIWDIVEVLFWRAWGRSEYTGCLDRDFGCIRIDLAVHHGVSFCFNSECSKRGYIPSSYYSDLRLTSTQLNSIRISITEEYIIEGDTVYWGCRHIDSSSPSYRWMCPTSPSSIVSGSTLLRCLRARDLSRKTGVQVGR